MGGVNVKNTIVERVLQVIAPHPCFGCGKIGTILCVNCKYDITSEPFYGCFMCGSSKTSGICEHHSSPISHSYIATSYSGVVKNLISALKFHHLRAGAKTCAEIINSRLPVLPGGAVLVPVPTVRSHVRERGYDQTALIAAHLANIRNAKVLNLVKRVNKATQHTSNKADRSKQAKGAFRLSASPRGLDEFTGPIVIIDDVVTTGATAEAVARALEPLGRPIWLATVSYKPLD